MRWLTAKTQITIGLLGVVTIVFITALFFGLVPDQGRIELHHRNEVCDSMAVTSSLMIQDDKLKTLKHFINQMVERNSLLQSVGVRRRGGKMVVSTKDHEALWSDQSSIASRDKRESALVSGKDSGDRSSTRLKVKAGRGCLAVPRRFFAWADF